MSEDVDPPWHDAKSKIRVTAGRLTCRYLLALGLIAALSCAAFTGQRLVVRSQDANSTVINVSAGQRTLAQRIAFLAERMATATAPIARAGARARLAAAVDRMERSHRALIHGDPELGLPREDAPALRAMYFEPPLELDVLVSDFLLSAATLVALPDASVSEDHPDLRIVRQAAAGPLLDALDVAVGRYEAQAKAEIGLLKTVEAVVLGVTLTALLLEALVIFRPMVRRVQREAAGYVDSQAALQRLAHHDALTGLPNRTLFQIRLDAARAQARRDGTWVAILQLDLDHFKDVNDTLGHAAGDHLLREVGRRLQALLREADTVARMGGDEFAIILTGVRARHAVRAVAQKIVNALQYPVRWQHRELHLSTSVGITLYPNDDDQPEQLLRNADIALYQAKFSGRSNFAFFTGEMRERIERRAHLEDDLRHGVARGEFEIFFQPQVRISDGVVVAVEALLRWRHPERGLLGPGAFVAVAEDTGLIVPIGSLILEHALRQLAAWQRRGIAPSRVAVNVAGAQLRTDSFVGDLEAALHAAGIGPEQLELEISEGVMLGRGHERIGVVLSALRQRGISVALDDFGTGYASLAHLKRIKVDRLKVDCSFVRDIATDPEDAAIVRAVVNLGHSLGQEVIAEGVETEQQLSLLRRLGCHLAQGFRFARPTPAAQLEPMLRAGRMDEWASRRPQVPAPAA